VFKTQPKTVHYKTITNGAFYALETERFMGKPQDTSSLQLYTVRVTSIPSRTTLQSFGDNPSFIQSFKLNIHMLPLPSFDLHFILLFQPVTIFISFFFFNLLQL
jgi:hypothetical protein